MREADGPRPSRLHTDLKSDAEIAVEALRGSGAACEALVRRFERPIYNLIARLVQDPGMSEDLTQETFIKMFRALGTFDPQQRFSSWLFRIAHNTAIDYLRQRRLAVVTPHVDDDETERDPLTSIADIAAVSPERAASNRELAAALDAAIDRLRPEYRSAIVLRHQEGLEYDEIAHVLGLPLGTVKTYLHRARRELARHLGAAGFGPETRSTGGA
jgi:RNA polymerase sigma-70 factor (ECF subfamily)